MNIPQTLTETWVSELIGNNLKKYEWPMIFTFPYFIWIEIKESLERWLQSRYEDTNIHLLSEPDGIIVEHGKTDSLWEAIIQQADIEIYFHPFIIESENNKLKLESLLDNYGNQYPRVKGMDKWYKAKWWNIFKFEEDFHEWLEQYFTESFNIHQKLSK